MIVLVIQRTGQSMTYPLDLKKKSKIAASQTTSSNKTITLTIFQRHFLAELEILNLMIYTSKCSSRCKLIKLEEREETLESTLLMPSINEAKPMQGYFQLTQMDQVPLSILLEGSLSKGSRTSINNPKISRNLKKLLHL